MCLQTSAARSFFSFLEHTFVPTFKLVADLFDLTIDANFVNFRPSARKTMAVLLRDDRWYRAQVDGRSCRLQANAAKKKRLLFDGARLQTTHAVYRLRTFHERVARNARSISGLAQMQTSERIVVTRHLIVFLVDMQVFYFYTIICKK